LCASTSSRTRTSWLVTTARRKRRPAASIARKARPTSCRTRISCTSWHQRDFDFHKPAAPARAWFSPLLALRACFTVNPDHFADEQLAHAGQHPQRCEDFFAVPLFVNSRQAARSPRSIELCHRKLLNAEVRPGCGRREAGELHHSAAWKQ